MTKAVWGENTKDTIIIKADVNHGEKRLNVFLSGFSECKRVSSINAAMK